jgi:hypothetical protein
VYGRVLGRLAVTRAFGDFDCKNIEVPNDDNEKEIKNFVLIEPEVIQFEKVILFYYRSE